MDSPLDSLSKVTEAAALGKRYGFTGQGQCTVELAGRGVGRGHGIEDAGVRLANEARGLFGECERAVGPANLRVAVRREEPRQRDVGFDRLRLEPNALLELLHRFVDAAVGRECERQIEARGCRVRPQLGGPRVMPDRFGNAAGIVESATQVIVRFSTRGLELDGPLEVRGGFHPVAERVQHVAQVVVRTRVIRPEPQRSLVVVPGLLPCAASLVDEAEIGRASCRERV